MSSDAKRNRNSIVTTIKKSDSFKRIDKPIASDLDQSLSPRSNRSNSEENRYKFVTTIKKSDSFKRIEKPITSDLDQSLSPRSNSEEKNDVKNKDNRYKIVTTFKKSDKYQNSEQKRDDEKMRTPRRPLQYEEPEDANNSYSKNEDAKSKLPKISNKANNNKAQTDEDLQSLQSVSLPALSSRGSNYSDSKNSGLMRIANNKFLYNNHEDEVRSPNKISENGKKSPRIASRSISTEQKSNMNKEFNETQQNNKVETNNFESYSSPGFYSRKNKDSKKNIGSASTDTGSVASKTNKLKNGAAHTSYNPTKEAYDTEKKGASPVHSLQGSVISNSKSTSPLKNGGKKYFYDSTREEYVPDAPIEKDMLKKNDESQKIASPKSTTKEVAVDTADENELKNSRASQIVQTDTTKEELEVLKNLSLKELSPRGSVYDDPNTLYLIRTADNKYMIDTTRNVYVTKHQNKTLTIVSDKGSKKSRILLGNGKVTYGQKNSKKNQQPVLLGFIPMPVNGFESTNSNANIPKPFNPYENDPYYTTFVDADKCHKCNKKIESVNNKNSK